MWSGCVFKLQQGFWGMPRGSVPMKDVPSGDTRWGAASSAMIHRFPNGATRPGVMTCHSWLSRRGHAGN